jgi:hypothetical protein
MDNYVRYDEIEDVLASTHLLAIVIPRLNQEPSLWKWAVIAAHNALQGAIVCALHDSIGVSVLTDKSARSVLKLHDQSNPLQGSLKDYPREHLEQFWPLAWRLCRQNPRIREQITRAQIRDIRKLQRRRNEFEHFTPKGWSIEKADLSKIIGTAIEVIEVAMQHDKVTYRLTEDQVRRLSSNLGAVRTGLNS